MYSSNYANEYNIIDDINSFSQLTPPPINRQNAFSIESDDVVNLDEFVYRSFCLETEFDIETPKILKHKSEDLNCISPTVKKYKTF